MAKFKWGQDVIIKKTGERTHIVGVGSSNRYILHNGDNVYDYEIKEAPGDSGSKKRFGRK